MPWTLQHYAREPVEGWYPLRTGPSADACKRHARGSLNRAGDRWRILDPQGRPHLDGETRRVRGWSKTVWTG